MLRTLSLPLKLLAVIGIVMFAGHLFTPDMVRFFFTISTIFKELLALLLPCIIMAFIISGILSFKRNAPLVLLLMLSCILLSNALVTMLSYFFVSMFLPVTECPVALRSLDLDMVVTPYTSLGITSPISATHVLIVSVIAGILFTCWRVPVVERAVHRFKALIETVLLRFFIPLLPLYVFGYLLEINSRGIFGSLFEHYGNAILLIIGMQLLFITLFFLIATGSFTRCWRAIKNALPSYVTALSTISSTATIPVTVACAEKNTGNEPLAEMSIPIMANVHLMGASINIPVLSLATLLLFKSTIPTFAEYSTFVFYFCTSMFAVTGIPGAGLFVMTPLLEDYFLFNPLMITVLTALYLLLDALSAATNVMGDGALIIILDKLMRKLNIK